MQRMPSRSGFTLVGVVLALLVGAVIVLAVMTVNLRVKVQGVDERGERLSAWIGQTDDAMNPDFAGGLTSYLIAQSKHLKAHEEKTLAAGAHGTAMPPDSHLDPPPPPVW